MKIYTLLSIKEKHTIQLLKQEAKFMQQFNHKNIVKCLQSYENDQYIVLTTKFYNQGDLEQQIAFARQHQGTAMERKMLKTSVIACIIGQLARALQYIHKFNIIHRDVKSSNILLEQTPDQIVIIKLTDFGVSRELQQGNQAQTLVGSVSYAAPEILRGQSYKKSVDIWSLGMCLYEMLYLKFPDNFEAKIRSQAFGYIKCQPTQYANKYLIKIMEGCLRENPDSRISIEEILQFPYISKVMNLFDQRTQQYK